MESMRETRPATLGLPSAGRRRALPLVALCLALLSLLAAGCGGDGGGYKKGGGGGGDAKASATVSIASFKFTPNPIRVKAGGKVTWVNRDKAPHTAQTDLDSAKAVFDTRTLDPGERKTVTLSKPGRYSYFCAFHAFMKGTVEVVE